MNRTVTAALGAVAGAAIAALAVLCLRPAANAPVPNALTVEEAARWTYDKDGVWIGDLTISADHKALRVTAPGISARIRNDSGDRMIVALHVVLLDQAGNLIAAECLSNPPAGVIEPGEEKTVAVMLQVPSGDIARARHVRLRVTRAAVHRMQGSPAISL